jgi:hypothetical protein
MANPQVRPHLHFYPEETRPSVGEYYQADHWREIDGDKAFRAAPMSVIRGQHYYLYEPCLLTDGRVCMPYEWFLRDGHLNARVWALHAIRQPESGWVVEEFHTYEVSEEHFSLGFGSWGLSSQTEHLPTCTVILGK